MYDLKDVTFVIPVRFDSEDRYNNLNIILSFLSHHFDTNIIVGEEDSVQRGGRLSLLKKFKYLYFPTKNRYFHRTKLLNQLYQECETEIIVNHDSDVLFGVGNYLKSVELIRKNMADIIYPFSGKFLDVNKAYHNQIKKDLSIKSIKSISHHVRDPHSLGGAIFFKRKVLLDGGMENEKFKAWGAEDKERYERFSKLGYRIHRLKGDLFHLVHSKGPNSNKQNPYFYENQREYERVKRMSVEELRVYIRDEFDK